MADHLRRANLDRCARLDASVGLMLESVMNKARLCLFLGAWMLAALSLPTTTAAAAWLPVRSVSAPEASQAAAADARFVFAVGSAVVAKYDRASGERLALSTGDAKHLNSGYLWEGKLYCAHSNYPAAPARSEIMVLDPATMVISTFKDFGEDRGYLTWCVRESGNWWCTFARYGKENASTALVKFDDDWHESGAWTYPPELVNELGNYSISGGIWKDGRLLATGHDRRVIYRLHLPAQGTVLELIDKLSSPFPGQGIAADPVSGGLVGIDRAKKAVIFAELGTSNSGGGSRY
jgi:hypothetical protein